MQAWLSDRISDACGREDVFRWVDGLEGKVFRALENRRTINVELNGLSCFVKVHRGTSWKEIFKNLLTLRLPVVGARNEWRALRKLESLHIDAPIVEGFGERGLLPSSLFSFIVTRDIGEAVSLEDVCADWADARPAYLFKTMLLERVAAITRNMHEAGMCHRDLYICHFMFAAQSDRLFLIDLHRALVKNNLRERWKVKDVAALLFSIADAGLTRTDKVRFMQLYSGKALRETLREDASFWNDVTIKAERISSRGRQQ